MGRKSKGKRIHSAGYVVISGGRHGTYEHRDVAEKKIGRKLSNDEDAHHVNEIKTDNDPANIEVLPKADHTRLHHPRRRIAVPCGQCGKPLEVHPYKLRYSKSGKVFCNKTCSGLFNNGDGIRGNPFTEDEVTRISTLRKQGKNYNQIAVAVGRNRESIRTLLLRKEKPCVL
jgi:hypothetical protein